MRWLHTFHGVVTACWALGEGPGGAYKGSRTEVAGQHKGSYSTGDGLRGNAEVSEMHGAHSGAIGPLSLLTLSLKARPTSSALWGAALHIPRPLPRSKSLHI